MLGVAAFLTSKLKGKFALESTFLFSEYIYSTAEVFTLDKITCFSTTT